MFPCHSFSSIQYAAIKGFPPQAMSCFSAKPNPIPVNRFEFPCFTTTRKCVLSSPTHFPQPVSIKFWVIKVGVIFPGPKGANCFKILKNFGVMSSKFISASMVISGVKKFLSMVSETTFSNSFLKFSKSFSNKVNPAAYICPPNCSICSEQHSSAL